MLQQLILIELMKKPRLIRPNEGDFRFLCGASKRSVEMHSSYGGIESVAGIHAESRDSPSWFSQPDNFCIFAVVRTPANQNDG